MKKCFEKVIFITLIAAWVFLLCGSVKCEDKVLARVGDQVITLEKFNKRISQIPPFFRQRLNTYEGKKEFLKKLIETKLFLKEALRLNLDKDPDVKARIEYSREQILANEYIKRQLINIKEEELRAYYDKHKKEFFQKEAVKLRYSVFKTEKEAKEALKKGSLKRRWAKWVERGQLPPKLEDVVFSLKTGEVSDVIKAGPRYYIAKVEEKREARQKGFSEVRNLIFAKLRQKKQATALKKLKKNTEIIINEELLKK
ncbi:MAG: hypothetical protein DRG39_06515 [Deltaproteobacteria bacterium]|nr:MAG: hypothetical protein DRG39_06515 [Deltaproteobacteria bacterium]